MARTFDRQDAQKYVNRMRALVTADTPPADGFDLHYPTILLLLVEEVIELRQRVTALEQAP
jgi:hypothetical protein